MALSQENKDKVLAIIFERACEIETLLSEDNFFRASMAGVAPHQVTEVALKAAIMQIKREFNKTV